MDMMEFLHIHVHHVTSLLMLHQFFIFSGKWNMNAFHEDMDDIVEDMLEYAMQKIYHKESPCSAVWPFLYVITF